MAIINNNVQNVSFLRNQTPLASREAALTKIEEAKANALDGSALLARYSGGTVGESDFFINTLVGFVAANGNDKYLTVFDVEGSSADVEELRQQMLNTFGSGVTTANTATAQLEALSGNNESTSAETSVEGAKRYADDLISTLDGGITAETGYYVKSVSEVDGKISGTTEALPTVAAITENGKAITAVSESNGTISATAGTIDAQYVDVTGFTATDVQGALEEVKANIGEAISGLDYSDTAVAGEYVSQVTETDGVIAVTRVALPSSADTAQAKKVVIAVSEDKGQIEVSRGSITSDDKTVVLGDASDGGVDFSVNIDNDTLQKDENGVISVTSSALVQYEGDTKTIEISPVQNGVRTVSSIITLSSITPSSTTVKEEYALKNASGETIGSTIKIYKDSSIVEINYITDPADEHYQNLEYIYIDASGNTQTEYVDMSSLVLEAEFASGVTFSDGVAHGVVDTTSETFLTVGANGFKLAGVQDAIDAAVSGAVETLDADVSGNSAHVTVGVVEEDGVITAVTVSEDNIASKTDIDALSAKTITEVTSSNASITAAETEAADGTTSLDIITDADKIKMSGFSADSTSSLSGIAESDSIATAFEKTNTVITENERVIAAALTDLDERVDTISGDVNTIKDEYISGVSVNGIAVTPANKVAPIAVSSSQSAATATNNEAIVVTTDNATGAITLGISSIDCGYYS